MSTAEAFRYFMPGALPSSGCWIWTGPKTSRGYGTLTHGSGNARISLRAHRVSYELFVGTIPTHAVVRHTCDVPSCVHPQHLLVGTQGDNVRDMMERERQVVIPRPGSRHHNTRLTEESVLQIRALYATGQWSQRELGEMFGLSQTGIGLIVRRVNWAHV